MDFAQPQSHPRETLTCIGHEAAKEAFETAKRSGRMHHSWVLCGPQGVGKRTFAYQVARLFALGLDTFQALSTTSPQHPIFQQIGAQTYPHLVTLEPEARGKSIAVEKIHCLIPFLQHTTPPTVWRVVIIEGVDWLNRSAANALLKAIEEPAQRVLFLLLAEDAHGMLPTLRSRCRLLTLHPLSQDELAQHISAAQPDLKPQERQTLLDCAQGCWGRARFLLQEGYLGKIMAFFALLDTTKGASQAPVMTPKDLALLETEAVTFWEPFFFIWLETQALKAMKNNLQPLPLAPFRQIFKEQTQFHLDIKHFWVRLLGALYDLPRQFKETQTTMFQERVSF